MVENRDVAVQLRKARKENSDRAACPHGRDSEIGPKMLGQQLAMLVDELFQLPGAVGATFRNLTGEVLSDARRNFAGERSVVNIANERFTILICATGEFDQGTRIGSNDHADLSRC